MADKGGFCVNIPAPSKGWCLNPKELFSGSPWRVHGYFHFTQSNLKQLNLMGDFLGDSWFF